MFKDIGVQILIKWKLYQVLRIGYPLILIVGISMVFLTANLYENNSIDGNAFPIPILSHKLTDSITLNMDQYYNKLQSIESTDGLTQFVHDSFISLGLDTYVNKYSIVGRFRAKRSPSYECNLITFQYGNGGGQSNRQIRNIAMALSYIHALQTEDINYLSRDIIFVGIDNHYQTYGEGIQQFINEYLHPIGITQMPRSGVIRQAININVDDQFDAVALKIFGINSRVPDRDFFLTVNNMLDKSQVQFTYTEKEYPLIKQYEKQLEQTIRYVWNTLDLNFIYRLPSRLINVAKYFTNLSDSIQGNLHEAHAYLINEGVQSVTIRGYNSKPNKQETSKLSLRIVLAIEAANRGLMALDEHVHTGSTMFIPMTMGTSITIKGYWWPFALILTAYVVAMYKEYLFAWFLNKDRLKNEQIGFDVAMVALRELIYVIMGFALCVAPLITNYLSKYIVYDIYYIHMLVCVGIVLAFKLLQLCCNKYYFNQWSVNRSAIAYSIMRIFLILQLNLGMIHCIIYAGIGYVLSLFVTPILIFVQPIRPQPTFNWKCIPMYLINLVCLYYIYIMYQYLDIEIFLRDLLNNYMHAGVHLYYFVFGLGIPSILKHIDMLIF